MASCSFQGSGRVVSASDSETSVLSSMPTSAIIYDAYTSIIKNKKKQKKTKVYWKVTVCADISKTELLGLIDIRR